MGTEFVSSEKGVAFIAVTLGAFVLVSFVVLGEITLGSKYQGGTRLESTVRKQDAELEHIRKELRLGNVDFLARKSMSEAMKTTARSEREIAAGLDELRLRHGKLLQLVDAKREELCSLQGSYRARARSAAVGESFKEFVTLDQKAYNDVTITGVTAVGISIRHRDGTTRISAQNLPSEFWHRFDFNLPEMAGYGSEVESVLELAANNHFAAADAHRRGHAMQRIASIDKELETLRDRLGENQRLFKQLQESTYADHYGQTRYWDRRTANAADNAKVRGQSIRVLVGQIENEKRSLERFLTESR